MKKNRENSIVLLLLLALVFLILVSLSYALDITASVWTLPGDVNGDTCVDIFDLGWMGKTYGSAQGQPRFEDCFDLGNDCDLNNDGKVDIFDLARVGKYYGSGSGCTP